LIRDLCNLIGRHEVRVRSSVGTSLLLLFLTVAPDTLLSPPRRKPCALCPFVRDMITVAPALIIHEPMNSNCPRLTCHQSGLMQSPPAHKSIKPQASPTSTLSAFLLHGSRSACIQPLSFAFACHGDDGVWSAPGEVLPRNFS